MKKLSGKQAEQKKFIKDRDQRKEIIKNDGIQNPPHVKSVTDKSPFPNVFKMIGFLSVIYIFVKSISEHGFLMKKPLSTATHSDLHWLFVVHSASILRNTLFYHIETLFVLELIFILITEGLISYTINRKIEYVYFRCWSHILCLVCDIKLYSFAVYRKTNKKPEYIKYVEFLSYPVLVFRDDFKRKISRNYKAIFLYILKFMLSFLVICFLMDQQIGPCVNRLHSILNQKDKKSIVSLIESSLLLSISTTTMFLMFFKVFFVYLLGLICELNKLDHKFFDKWWNAESTADFWRTWNVEFHEFAKVHIHLPLKKRGIHRITSNFIVFLISGLIHEYVVSMTVRSLDGLFLIAMISQIPFHFVSEVVKRKFPIYSNLFFLVCFSGIGQPLFLYLIVSKYKR